MFKVALEMLLYSKPRCISAVVGITVAFFLCAAQIGLLVGWCNTTSAIILHANADVWSMAKETCAFDYGTAIPKNRIYQVRSIPGVAWAEGAAGQSVTITGRGLGDRRFEGRLSLVKQLMGKKTVFTRDAAERKDLDVIQCWIEPPGDFQAPLGLQVDIDVDVSPAAPTASIHHDDVTRFCSSSLKPARTPAPR